MSCLSVFDLCRATEELQTTVEQVVAVIFMVTCLPPAELRLRLFLQTLPWGNRRQQKTAIPGRGRAVQTRGTTPLRHALTERGLHQCGTGATLRQGNGCLARRRLLRVNGSPGSGRSSEVLFAGDHGPTSQQTWFSVPQRPVTRPHQRQRREYSGTIGIVNVTLKEIERSIHREYSGRRRIIRRAILACGASGGSSPAVDDKQEHHERSHGAGSDESGSSGERVVVALGRVLRACIDGRSARSRRSAGVLGA